MQDKIKEMRTFLWKCRMTEYLLPEQIALLSMGLDALELALLFADADRTQALDEVLERKTAELKEVSV